MSTEDGLKKHLINMFDIEQLFAEQNEVNIPTRYGVLIRPNLRPLIVTTYTGNSGTTVLDYPMEGKTKLKTNNVRFCGVISASSDKYKLLVHAPSPRELGLMTRHLLSEIPDKRQLRAKLYLNPQECKRKFPSFINGGITYQKVFDEICKDNKLISKGVSDVDNDSQIVC